jgi:hypothetical protein
MKAKSEFQNHKLPLADCLATPDVGGATFENMQSFQRRQSLLGEVIGH